MKIKEIVSYLEEIAPLSMQENYDNCGLLVGDAESKCKGVLITLDCIEETVEEAVKKGCNLIIAHHPIIFSGLKSLTGKNYIERTVLRAIKNDIAIYAIHTNLDNHLLGVNREIGERLGLEKLKILSPKRQVLTKLVCFVPRESIDQVKTAMFDAGAGEIGNYSSCSFEVEGTGQFKANDEANPHLGERGKIEKVKELRLEVLVSNHKLNQVLSAMFEAHPYEEVAYELYPISNVNQTEGAGMIGELKQAIPTIDFLKLLKETFHCGVIRHTKIVKDKVQKIAFCGGAGSFLLKNAIRQQADIFITGDFKYHEFFDAEDKVLIADIGHFESEQFTSHRLKFLLKKKFTNFAVRLTEVNTNPINYF